MTDEEKQTTAQRAIGDFAPKLVKLTTRCCSGMCVWERAELSKRDRSLVTVAALVAGGNTEQLRNQLLRAKANGLTAMSAIQVAKAAFAD
jgi:4-carboxymuconolactone decarboxylase